MRGDGSEGMVRKRKGLRGEGRGEGYGMRDEVRGDPKPY